MAIIREKYAVPGTELNVFIPTKKTGEEKRKDRLKRGDKVLLPVQAVVTKRFWRKSDDNR